MEEQKKQDKTVSCRACPYPSTDFLCSGSDGECMKTRMQKIKNMASKGESRSVRD